MLLLTLLCQSQASFVIVILFSPFFWRSGYSSIAASTPSSPTRPVNDKDHELLFTKYIFSIMTSVTAIDSSSAIERRMTPFHALNDSSSGRKQFVGGASCFTILCVYVKQGLPPAYDGRNTTILHFQFTPRAGKPCQNHVIIVESLRANHARVNHVSKNPGLHTALKSAVKTFPISFIYNVSLHRYFKEIQYCQP